MQYLKVFLSDLNNIKIKCISVREILSDNVYADILYIK